MHTHQRPSMPGQFRAKFVAETPRTNPTKQGLLSGGTMELAPGFRVDIKYMTMGQYYMHTRVSTDTYTHIHIHTHTYTHIYTHTRTHTHAPFFTSFLTRFTRYHLIYLHRTYGYTCKCVIRHPHDRDHMGKAKCTQGHRITHIHNYLRCVHTLNTRYKPRYIKHQHINDH